MMEIVFPFDYAIEGEEEVSTCDLVGRIDLVDERESAPKPRIRAPARTVSTDTGEAF